MPTLTFAVKNAVWSVYLHQGQIYLSAGRVLVHSGIAGEDTRRLADHAGKLSVGDPASGRVAVGPLINRAQPGAADLAFAGDRFQS